MFHATSCSEKAIADDFFYDTHNHTLYACITKDPKTCHRETKYICNVHYLESFRTIPRSL